MGGSYTILTVGPNLEPAVSRTLDLLDVPNEWFRVRRRVVYRGRLILRVMALFPGYMFIIAKSLWMQIERVIGVRGFVRFGGVIENVPERVVAQLRERAGASGILDEDAMPFHQGQPVWLRVGGQQQPGIFKEYLGPTRVLVEVSMFGRMTCVTARLGELRRAVD